MSFIETEKKTPLESVTSCWTRIRQTSPVYNFFFTDIALVSARHGSMLAHLPVGLNHINSKHTLHGTAKEGDVLTIEGKVSRVGRNMAFTTVTIYKGEGVDGSLEGLTVVATGTHTKYILRDQEQARKP
jgi:acyl-coenzyme A thioesterase 13